MVPVVLLASAVDLALVAHPDRCHPRGRGCRCSRPGSDLRPRIPTGRFNRVRYLTEIRGLGLSRPVDLRGGALLEIVVQTPYGPDPPSVASTYAPRNPRELVDVAGWRTFRQVSLVEVYESQITVGLVVRARLPFRVYTLDGPGQRSQLAIDVAHRW